jgi:putative DNA primase/helicase
VAVSGQVKRVVHRFAHVAACGELATELGITGWPVGESLKAAADCFQAWIEDRGGVADNLEDVKAIAQVREFFQRHGSSRFPPLLTIQDGRIQINTADKTHNRAGFQMAAGGKTEFLVFPEVYKKEICSGFEWRKFTRLLLATGLLIPDKDEPRKAQSRHTVPGHGRIRLYHFAAEVLGKDD